MNSRVLLITVIPIYLAGLVACENNNSKPQAVSDYQGIKRMLTSDQSARIRAVVELKAYQGTAIIVLHPTNDHKLAGIVVNGSKLATLREKLALVPEGKQLIIESTIIVSPILYEFANNPLYDPIASCEVVGEFSTEVLEYKLREAILPSK